MISKVDIYNMALGHIAIDDITSPDEDSEPARKCELFWLPSLKAILRAHDWGFAGQNEALAVIADETIIGWTYLYKYPANCLMLRKIYNEGTDLTQVRTDPFKVTLSPDTNQKSIASNLQGAYIEYTTLVEDPTLYDASFVEAVSFKLASFLAKPLTGDSSMREALTRMAMATVESAKSNNKTETHETQKRVSKYVTARG